MRHAGVLGPLAPLVLLLNFRLALVSSMVAVAGKRAPGMRRVPLDLLPIRALPLTPLPYVLPGRSSCPVIGPFADEATCEVCQTDRDCVRATGTFAATCFKGTSFLKSSQVGREGFPLDCSRTERTLAKTAPHRQGSTPLQLHLVASPPPVDALTPLCPLRWRRSSPTAATSRLRRSCKAACSPACLSSATLRGAQGQGSSRLAALGPRLPHLAPLAWLCPATQCSVQPASALYQLTAALQHASKCSASA